MLKFETYKFRTKFTGFRPEFCCRWFFFHAHVCWNLRLKSFAPNLPVLGPNFAAADLFPRACILENVTFDLSHENQKKEAQIRRRWFISTRKYRGKIFFGSFY